MSTRGVLLLDALLAFALAASLVGLLRSSDLHGVLSLLLVGVVIGHVAVHRRWVVRAVRRSRRASPRRTRVVRDLTVATGLATLFVPMAATGLSLLTNLDRGDDVHTVTGWFFVGLVALHVGLHARWVRRAVAIQV